MASNKTAENEASVLNFINAVEKEQKRNDVHQICKWFEEITKSKPKMWGSSIIGFGKYHYKYKSGREGEFMRIGFSPRKANISFYIMDDHSKYKELFEKLGKHKSSKACLYVNKLADVDEKILKKIIKKSWDCMIEKYG